MPLPLIAGVAARAALSKPGRKLIGKGFKKVVSSKRFETLTEALAKGGAKAKKRIPTWEQSVAKLNRTLKYTPKSR